MNMHYRESLVEHYAAVRARLRAPVFDLPEIEAPVEVLLLDYQPEPYTVVDLVPDQRNLTFMKVEALDAAAEILAARRALASFARMRTEHPSMNSVRQLQIAVAAAFKIDVAIITGPSRRHGPVRVRQIAQFLAAQVCATSRADIARRFRRDHATVFHAIKKFAGFLDGATSQIGSGS
jgi:hypothetical protein